MQNDRKSFNENIELFNNLKYENKIMSGSAPDITFSKVSYLLYIIYKNLLKIK